MYYNAKTIEVRVLEHAQRYESCEELSKSEQQTGALAPSLYTGCTSTADNPSEPMNLTSYLLETHVLSS